MPVSSSRKLNPKEFDQRKAMHLLQRAGFGGTPQQAEALANMGLEEAVSFIVNYDNIRDLKTPSLDDYDKDIMRPATPAERDVLRKARENGNEEIVDRYRKERQQRQRDDRKQISDMERWWLQRMITTPRPLEEKLTLFWHGHFATGLKHKVTMPKECEFFFEWSWRGNHSLKPPSFHVRNLFSIISLSLLAFFSISINESFVQTIFGAQHASFLITKT
jgi:hypothetical protein